MYDEFDGKMYTLTYPLKIGDNKSTLTVTKYTGAPNKRKKWSTEGDTSLTTNCIGILKGMLQKFYDSTTKTSRFSDIAVKFQDETYHLNKAILVVNSQYFERLFTGDFVESLNQEIEIHSIKSDSFSITKSAFADIVSMMYGEPMSGVLGVENCADLLIALDYFGMEIDMFLFYNFLKEKRAMIPPSVMFTLYKFVLSIHAYDTLLPLLRKYFSDNITAMNKAEGFYAIEFKEFMTILNIKLLSYKSFSSLRDERMDVDEVCNLCAKWICYDLPTRKHRITDVVNMTKKLCNFAYGITDVGFEIPEDLNEETREKRLKYYLTRLVCGNAEINPNTSRIFDEFEINCNTVEPALLPQNQTQWLERWKLLLDEQRLCDFTIQVETEIFHLHRIKLALMIPYFHDLFIEDGYSKNDYKLDNIEADAFKVIIRYAYHKDISFGVKSPFVSLLKASDILRMETITKRILNYVTKNVSELKEDTLLDLLLLATKEEEKFNEISSRLYDCVCQKWFDICTKCDVGKITFEVLQHILKMTDLQLRNDQDILDVCCKWIDYDIQGRFYLIPELAVAINNNVIMNLDKYRYPYDDKDSFNKTCIKNRLKEVLLATKLLTDFHSVAEPDAIDKACFVVAKFNKMMITDIYFNDLLSISTLHDQIPKHISAVTIKDNVFLTFVLGNRYNFLVCNMRTKSVVSSNFPQRISVKRVTLLSDLNDLFFCGEFHHIFKYSKTLNRWVEFLKEEIREDAIYTIRGHVLYKIFRNTDSHLEVKCYDLSTPSPSPISSYEYTVVIPRTQEAPLQALAIQDYVHILFPKCTLICQLKSRRWLYVRGIREKFSAFKQFADRIIYTTADNNIYSFQPLRAEWTLLKSYTEDYTVCSIFSNGSYRGDASC